MYSQPRSCASLIAAAACTSRSMVIDTAPAGSATGGPEFAATGREAHASGDVPCRLDGVLVLSGGRAVSDVRNDLRAVRPDPRDRGVVADHDVNSRLNIRAVLLGEMAVGAAHTVRGSCQGVAQPERPLFPDRLFGLSQDRNHDLCTSPVRTGPPPGGTAGDRPIGCYRQDGAESPPPCHMPPRPPPELSHEARTPRARTASIASARRRFVIIIRAIML